jgi:hypothetical protein
VLDLRGVTFPDSTALHLALEADAASRAQGWEFGLIGGPAHPQRVFDLTGSRAKLPFLRASELGVLLTAPGEAPACCSRRPAPECVAVSRVTTPAAWSGRRRAERKPNPYAHACPALRTAKLARACPV